MDRVITGISGLDRVLGGGIPQYSTVLIAGAPGVGKTILTQHILYNVQSQTGNKVIYFSTISEPQIKVLRFQQQFSFFDADAFMKSVLYLDLGSVLRTQGVKRALEIIDEAVVYHQPVMIALDSLKAVVDITSSYREFREFVSDLNLKLSIWGCTVLLIGEYFEDEIQRRPESAIVDGIIYLSGLEERRHQKRYLRIIKMRGTNYLAGEHLLKITSEGAQVYTRFGTFLEPPVLMEKELQPTGIPGLDRMLEGGIPAGTTTLVCGTAGTGKTISALSWLVQGASAGEKGEFFSFDSSPQQLIEMAGAFGWVIKPYLDQGLLKFNYVSPIELDVELQIYEIQALAEAGKVKRIVLDSLSTLEMSLDDRYKYTNFIWGISHYLKTKGISLMILNETLELINITTLSKEGISLMADNIINFQYFVEGHKFHKLVGVLKMRGRNHRTTLHEFQVTSKGPIVLDHIVGCAGDKEEGGRNK